MVCGGSSCDIDKLELWRPTLFLEEILSVSAETQRFSLWASSPIPTNDHQKLYFIHFIKNMFIYYLYLVSVLLVLDFLLQDIYFVKSLERHCCHQQWVQDMVSWARLSLVSAGSSHFCLSCLAASTIMSDSLMSCFLSSASGRGPQAPHSISGGALSVYLIICTMRA